ncbi:glucosamine--fructose-6-phosphate aminotransferase, isomerizing [Terriglobus roseus DSM 18391]|uniref:Glutamine--fructose-6-phosphate aminotransferase [isomerizing] n=1 Tax=Terriglobus roseus (strain DSM 18391 / NRRL B-41598 / KBS 63) TaxID=926566 RepID=I3ZE78_TERRK|nr:glutamine--fructose-6-phosphate transaminase (isomerizing) [Terriglobus roseus]AFL87546.1 glucosamine--fructose-6-phosphate aminotransferase, isomerizing [Terriglobus roseus DSM 18391]
MCGIVGYIGARPAVPVIMDGLRRLEYRGYDSAGIALGGADTGLSIRRASGKLRNLESSLSLNPLQGDYGIGHTRWATHGRPSETNAHPHRDCTGSLVVVHNGIVENYCELQDQLKAKGHFFLTETDTEIIAHLIEQEYLDLRERNDGDAAPSLEKAVSQAVKKLTGAFAIGVISTDDPGKLVAARSGPPAVVGFGDGEYFLASDVPGILQYTRDIVFLQDGDVAVLTRSGISFSDFHGKPLKRSPQHITWDPIQAEKNGYAHFMLKEIYEQPRAVRDTLRGRISAASGHIELPGLDLSHDEIVHAERILIASCGTSWHAGLVGKFLLERMVRIPVEVDYASEFRYRRPIMRSRDIGLLISQSGETADTLAAQLEMIAGDIPTLSICNVVDAALTRKARGSITTNAGPEIGVASTKAFTAQIAALLTLSLYFAQCRKTMPQEAVQSILRELEVLPKAMEEALRTSAPVCARLAKIFSNATDVLFLGRGIHYPIALEGALKLKEISYIHAEGYPAGEMKHGPNALIDETLPVVCLATKDGDDPDSVLKYEKTLSNIQEVTARGGRVIAIVVEGDTAVSSLVEHTITIPRASEALLPILETVPLQLLAYFIAVEKGCDVDQPRNLAKSVTVE